MIETIQRLGLNTHRARWTQIPPNCTTTWHRDTTSEDIYGVRLHIPVITNPGCAYETEEGSIHMPDDGSCYLIDVSRFHKAYNHGNENRIHIIMDVIDDAGVSKHHGSYKAQQANFRFNKLNIIRMIKKLFYRS